LDDMRVTILHSHFTSIGGAEVLLATQARWLVAAGHDVRIAAFRADADFCARLLPDFRVVEVGLPPTVRKLEQLTASMMPALIERTRPHLDGSDVVMAYNYPCAPVAAAAGEARRTWYACEPYRALYLREGNPAAAASADAVGLRAPDFASRQVARRLFRRRILHAVMPWTARTSRDLARFDGDGVRALDAVASLSRYGAACVEAAEGRTDVQVISPMVRMAPPAAGRRGVRRDAPQLLVQTRLGIPKNVDTLIRAIAIVRRTQPKVVLHVVGSGTRRTALERLAARVAPEAIRFHGFLATEALDTLAAACDIFAFAPVDEPFGMVFPEAAARGLLLVGSDHGGPREILADGALGELCNPFSPDSIAAAILRTLALSDADADERRAAADQSMRTRFGAETVGPQLEAFLRG